MKKARKLLSVAALVAVGLASCHKGDDSALPTSTPAAQGLDEVALLSVVHSIKDDRVYAGIDSLLIVRNGFLVVEEYFNGYRRSSLHTIQSVSKSVTSAVIGIAINKGIIPSVDLKVLSCFPEFAATESDGRKAAITLDNLLTMRSGNDYREGYPGSPHDQLNALKKDWDLFYLNRPMIRNPGEWFQYDSGGVILMSSLLKRLCGEHADALAGRYLFPRLDIEDFSWFRNSQGHPHTGGGLSLRPMDMAKFGLLYMENGKRKGLQVVPEEWVRESFRMHVDFHAPADQYELGYGYLWWILRPAPGGSGLSFIYAAEGYMGQYIFLVPEYGMVVVFTGSAKDGRAMSLPKNLLYAQILAAVRG
jgi:CubicO group peptidase (beta-lactamase class C family)